MKTTLLSLLLLSSCATTLPAEPEVYLPSSLSPAATAQELLASTSKDAPEYPTLLLRSCQAAEQDAGLTLRRLTITEDALCCNRHPDDEAALIKEQEELQRKYQEAQRRSLACYQELTQSYPGYERRDEALSVLGYLSQSQEQTAEARAAYETLLREYPQSRFAPAALLFLAEEAFNDNDVSAALALYQKIEAFPESSEYSFALYKKGWCLYNLADFEGAMLAFIAVVKLAQESGGKNVLAREARRDIARVYANFGDPREAADLFRSLKDPSQVAPMLKQLAYVYYDIGKYSDYKTLCQQSAASYPEINEACAQKTP